MFNLTPFKYLVEGLLGNAIGGVPVRCSQSEFSTLTPPTGQTCEQFLGGFSSNLDGVGNTNGSGYFTTAANGDCNVSVSEEREVACDTGSDLFDSHPLLPTVLSIQDGR